MSCADPESFVKGDLTLTFFLVDEGREDPNITISWRVEDGPTLNAGFEAL